ncbi:unnamed protein product [Rhodiola kirilowii]
MMSNKSKPPAAPRSINVQKFAESRGPELESLQSIVANRLNNDFRSQRNSRRRTTGHDDRLGKKNGRKRKSRGFGNTGSLEQVEGQKKVSRRVRRRMELRDNPVDGLSTSGDGTKRLRTHVWHAKRFTMTKLWGFHLPLGLQGRGRGSRALLKWYNQGALVHDASYYTCVELEGLETSLLSVLKMVLEPHSEIKTEDVCPVLSGTIYGTAMLYHVGSLSPQAVAPVTYMWRPVQPQKTRSDELCDKKECDDSNSLKHHSRHRQLWIWLHASAFDEGFEALKLASSRLMNETGSAITLSSLGGKITKFEVMGSKAWQLLQKVLKVFGSDNKWKLNSCSVLKPHSDPHQVKSLNLESEDTSASHSIMSLTVRDPRDLSVGVLASEGDAHVHSVCKTPNVEDEGRVAKTEPLDKYDNVSISSPAFANDNFSNGTLWDAKSGVRPPVDEHSLSMEKQNLRLTSYAIPSLSSKASVDLAKLKQPSSCPIMLVKEGSHTGWTIILPVNWAKTFWMPLILNGAHAIGLREKHWIASEVGLPFFPLDFPDCNAYASYKASEAAKFNLDAERRPQAVRPFRVPISSPWNCVQLALDADLSKPTSSNTNGQSGESDGVGSDSIHQSHDETRFSGTVGRTSSKLACFVNQSIGLNLPLFPLSKNKKMLSEWVLSENFDQNHCGTAQLKKDQNLFFVRVILHAYREGFFEDGAVVCAPFLSDIQSWKSSLDGEQERLHIPQSSVSSYFMEQSPGHWELQIPDDPTLLQTHRWPIGFVTSGFVRGSKKAKACSFCDASLLGCVRQEQWRNLPTKKRKKDIYVLVRNLKSNTYRLAVANIVLEHQAADTEFM